jgi:endoglycosylceramidase
MKSLAALLLGLAPAASIAGCGSTPPVDLHPQTCVLEPPALADWRLHADGTRLRDALGRVVVLRGVDAGGRSKFAPFAPFDFTPDTYDGALAAYLDRAASWGIDALRVPFVWEAVEPVQGMDDETFLERYDALLDAAWARGMFTVVDFHQDVYAEIYCGDGFPAWTVPGPSPAPHHDCPTWGTEYLTDADVQSAFDAFWADGSASRAAYDALWDRMVARYKDRPGVIGFEPLNEPGWGTADPDAWEATTLTTFYGDMTSRIREAAPGALVFFDTTGVDAVTLKTTLVRPAGDGLVFAPHYYQFAALGGAATSSSLVPFDLKHWATLGTTWNVPVLLGEFGTSNANPDAEAYMSAHYDALDALGMSGTQWEYSVATELWNSENLSLVAADGTENPTVKAIVRPYPRAVAGDDPAFVYDAATKAASLSYKPTSGVTEVSVPARAYPAGYDVRVTGGCADASRAGRLLVRAEAGATMVQVKVTPR